MFKITGHSLSLGWPYFISASNEPNSHPQDAFGVLAWIFGDRREMQA